MCRDHLRSNFGQFRDQLRRQDHLRSWDHLRCRTGPPVPDQDVAPLTTIVSQPSKCLKFMTFREGCFVIHAKYKYLSEALETFYHHQLYKR